MLNIEQEKLRRENEGQEKCGREKTVQRRNLHLKKENKGRIHLHLKKTGQKKRPSVSEKGQKNNPSTPEKGVQRMHREIKNISHDRRTKGGQPKMIELGVSPYLIISLVQVYMNRYMYVLNCTFSPQLVNMKGKGREMLTR